MLLKRIRQFGYMNLYGGMMVFNNMVPPYILVD